MQEWDRFTQLLEDTYGKRAIDTWVRPLSLSRFDACNIYLDIQDPFQASWVKEHVIPLASKHLRNRNGHKITIHIAKAQNQRRKEAHPGKDQTEGTYISNSFPLHLSFSQFIVNQTNSVPYHLLYNTVHTEEKPSYNPLFVFGPRGVGKTHLLCSCAQALESAGKKVLFVTGDTFTEHVVKAIRASRMQTFRDAYRNVDALIIDNIEVLGKRNATQEELFHTFNTLHIQEKLLILSANVNPQLLEDIEARLISRFEWGITLPLKPLDEGKHLKELIHIRSKFYNLHLEKDLIDELCQKENRASVIADIIDTIYQTPRLQQLQRPLSLAECHPIVEKILTREKKEGFNDEWILRTVSECFGVKVEDIVSKSQTKEAVLPRQIAMFLLRRELNFPFMKIGKIFKKDHSTVISSIKQIDKLIEQQDTESLYHLNAIRRKILQKH